MTIKGIKVLVEKCLNLMEIDITGIPVKNEELKDLKSKQLQKITYQGIDAEGLKAIADNCPNLKEAYFPYIAPSLTQKAYEYFMEKLPGVKARFTR